MRFLSLVAVLLAASSASLGFETCEECLENMVNFGALVNDHKVKFHIVKRVRGESIEEINAYRPG
jgi:hypothetical protein